MKAALRVLVLSPFPYSPYDGQGAAVLCSAQLSDLHLRHDVHVLVFSSPQQSNAVEWMRQHAGRVETVPLPSRNIFHRLWAAASLQAGRQFQSRRFQDALQAELATFKPDVVLIQFSSLAQYVEFCKPTRTVLDSHDVHWVSNLRQSTLGGGGMRAVVRAASWLRYEQAWYPEFDEVIALTELDAHSILIVAPTARVTVVRPAIAVPPPRMTTRGEHALFVGNFSHPPNLDALRFFADQVMPSILAREPAFRLRVVGKGLTPSMRPLRAGLEVAGFVPDVATEMGSARLLIAPLRSGSGIKIKVLEAMAAGCPVVGTPVAFEGIPIEHGKSALVAQGADDLARHAITLVHNKELAAAVGQAGRELVAKEFSNVGERLDRVLRGART